MDNGEKTILKWEKIEGPPNDLYETHLNGFSIYLSKLREDDCFKLNASALKMREFPLKATDIATAEMQAMLAIFGWMDKFVHVKQLAGEVLEKAKARR